MRDDWLASLGAAALEAQRAVAHGDPPSPALLRFLLRRYAATGDADVLEILEPALAQAVLAAAEAPLAHQPEWMLLFVEAAALSPDDRLQTTLASLAPGVIEQDFTQGRTGHLFRSITASIAAAAAHGDPSSSREQLQRAIHAMEDLVSAAYQPGAGVAHVLPRDRDRSRALRDQIDAATALLAAYIESARLPYSMLAEEFVQFARREWWNGTRGAFDSTAAAGDQPLSDEDFAANADAIRLFCRLAMLHRDEGYRSAAVLAPDADYLADANRMIEALAPDALSRDASLIGVYGLAVDDELRLQADLQ